MTLVQSSISLTYEVFHIMYYPHSRYFHLNTVLKLKEYIAIIIAIFQQHYFYYAELPGASHSGS